LQVVALVGLVLGAVVEEPEKWFLVPTSQLPVVQL
jgi:hypothetical protein